MVDVLLTNASYQVLSRIDWQRAVVLVVIGVAETIESHPTELVRSQHLSIPLPTIVRLREYRHVQFRDGDSRSPSFRQIRLRDGRRCAYCGGPGDTVDHVVPQSRGGSGHWDNLVCACRACNNRKADRTPLEAGMRLRWAPRPVLADDADQQKVWELLAAG
ncbi:MAG TPA: HNH endonuclease [Nakamurella sp.]|jgi:5-methylcytosine-specific restriction endonuclease McrA